MGTIVGAMIGYVFGTQAGPQGWDDLRRAWGVISSSEEVRNLIDLSFSMAHGLVGRGGELLAGAAGTSESRSALRPVA
ncbi:MAG: hypothetical protein ACRDY3_00170 [Acidimicrobiales bacterium]